ncbi:histidine phosphatase family protein [Paenibacillus radicis (ex Xue et al. 2023)]|uniref:Histidine phosphatase family protein n=1 Tax=Paenibacillus radicis (ex Xue et al. 2023) TaxID=2972489 RepID=A0ABT1YQC4_9BACL|nr:histidine phosphatase family protein [Paenibacillus radicis (ex Xue et al. 2023)]MCR8634483.1 histidine phosphatase family protein [Paenibacillus radicis (ex Xue et al. 2023)]
MITIGLIRHGTTEWNLVGRMQGQMDTDLAEVGRLQAERLGERLKSETWDGIMSSDLIRAKQTAQTISDKTGTPIWGLDSRLRERHFGQLEGTTLDDRLNRWGEGWRELDLGMESDEDLLARWFSFLQDLEAGHRGKKVLIVSHGGYIAPVLEHLMGKPVESHLSNTSLTVIKRDISIWNCLLLNCTAHLNDL